MRDAYGFLIVSSRFVVDITTNHPLSRQKTPTKWLLIVTTGLTQTFAKPDPFSPAEVKVLNAKRI